MPSFVEGALFFSLLERKHNPKEVQGSRWRILDAIHIRRRAADKGFRCRESEGSDLPEARREAKRRGEESQIGR